MRLVVERERERMAFVSASYHDVKALFTTGVGKEQDFEAKLLSIDGLSLKKTKFWQKFSQTVFRFFRPWETRGRLRHRGKKVWNTRRR